MSKVLPAANPMLAVPQTKREYVASMSNQLAAMAREEGDRLLAQALDLAAGLARRAR